MHQHLKGTWAQHLIPRCVWCKDVGAAPTSSRDRVKSAWVTFTVERDAAVQRCEVSCADDSG